MAGNLQPLSVVRQQVLKIVKERVEQARVSLRKLRDEIWNDIQRREKEGGMGEDDKFRLRTDIQKLIDEANKKLEASMAKKEKEILS